MRIRDVLDGRLKQRFAIDIRTGHGALPEPRDRGRVLLERRVEASAARRRLFDELPLAVLEAESSRRRA